MMRILLTIFISFSLHAQQEINRCAEEKEALMSYQKEMMDYRANGSSFQDLLERKNRLNANLALYDALTGIINDYYNYLAKSSNSDVLKIDQLQVFLQAQAPAAHRMNLSVDMINAIDAEGKLPSKRSQRFPIIKERLQKGCHQKPRPSYCLNLDSSFWNNLNPNNRKTQGASVNELMVENFIHLSSAAKDIGKKFIDDTNLDQVLKNDPTVRHGLIGTLSKAIDEAAKNCANRDLLKAVRSTSSNKCLDVKLTSLKANEQKVIERELNLSDNPTLGTAIDLYFKKISKAKQSQVKVTSQALSEILRSSSPNFSRADRALEREAKEKHEIDFGKKKRKLAGSIHGAFKIMVGEQSLANALTNDMTSQAFNPRVEQLAPLINKTLKELTGYEGSDLFDVKNGKISFNRLELTRLLDTNALSSRALKDKQLADINELGTVQAQINKLTKNKRFASLDALREFAWSNVRYYCSRNEDEYIKPNTKCSYQSAYSEGLNTLLKSSYDLEDFNETQYDLQRLDRILELCAAKDTPARDHTCAAATNKKSSLTQIYRQAQEKEREKALRRQELLKNDTHVYVFDKNQKIIGQRRRINGYTEGAKRGLASSVNILLPTTMQYMALGPQLQMAAIRGKQEKTYQAWMNRPQYDCRIYVCPNTNPYYYQYGSLGLNTATSLYNSPTLIAGPQGYQGFPQTNIQQQLLTSPSSAANQGFNFGSSSGAPPSANSFNLSRPTSP